MDVGKVGLEVVTVVQMKVFSALQRAPSVLLKFCAVPFRKQQACGPGYDDAHTHARTHTQTRALPRAHVQTHTHKHTHNFFAEVSNTLISVFALERIHT